MTTLAVSTQFYRINLVHTLFTLTRAEIKQTERIMVTNYYLHLFYLWVKLIDNLVLNLFVSFNYIVAAADKDILNSDAPAPLSLMCLTVHGM